VKTRIRANANRRQRISCGRLPGAGVMLYSPKPKCPQEQFHIPSNAEAGISEVFSVGENDYLSMIDDADFLL